MRGLTKDRDLWRIRFTSKHTKPGEVYRERLPPGTTKTAAEKYLIKLREDDRLGVLLWAEERRSASASSNTSTTLGEFALSDYIPYVAAHNAPKTAKNKASHLKHLPDWLWSLPLASVDSAALSRAAVERKRQGVRASTVNLEMRTVVGLLKLAHARGQAPSPPTYTKLPERDGKTIRWLSADQAQACLDAAAVRGPMWQALTVFLLHTGARWGEAFELQWEHVDLDAATVTIHATKTGRTRGVPLLPEVVLALRGLEQIGPLVFCRRWGGRIARPRRGRAGAVRWAWQPPDLDWEVTPHVFRHTFATWRLRAGVSIAKVQAWLGHASISMTVDTYGHVLPQDHAEDIARAPRPTLIHSAPSLPQEKTAPKKTNKNSG